MKKMPKQEYTAEFKELAVKRVKSGQTAAGVAKELRLIEKTLRNWVKVFDAGKLNAPGARQVTPERMELSRVRAANVRCQGQANFPRCGNSQFPTRLRLSCVVE